MDILFTARQKFLYLSTFISILFIFSKKKREKIMILNVSFVLVLCFRLVIFYFEHVQDDITLDALSSLVGRQLLTVWCLLMLWFCTEYGCKLSVIHILMDICISILKCLLKLTLVIALLAALAKAQQLLLDQQERDYIISQVNAAKGQY